MAWLSNNSVVAFGKHKGKKVSEITDIKWVKYIHNSDYNVYFKKEVIDRIGIDEKELIKTDNIYYERI